VPPTPREPLPSRSRPLTIAFQSLDYPGDANVSAIGIYTATVARALVARGHRVHVVSRTQDTASVLEQDGVTIHRIGPPRSSIPLSFGRANAALEALRALPTEYAFRRRLAGTLHELVVNESVDLLELADSGAEALFFRSGRWRGLAVVVRLHGPTSMHELFDRNVREYLRAAVQAVERRLALRATHFATGSAEARTLISRLLAIDDKRISVLPCPAPFDLDVRALARSARGTGRAEAGAPDLVVFIGRITAAKGVEALVDAVPRVRARRPGARFLFVGPDCSTGTRWPSTIAYLRSRLAPDDAAAVTFTGYVTHDEVTRHLQRATMCVFPSVFEVFGMVCLEAMAHGKAIVAGRTGGLRDMLDDGAAGVMYDRTRGDDLAEQIVALLDDPERRHALGEQARARAIGRYDPETVLGEYERFYQECVEEVRASPSS
jgi:glycogen synthase